MVREECFAYYYEISLEGKQLFKKMIHYELPLISFSLQRKASIIMNYEFVTAR